MEYARTSMRMPSDPRVQLLAELADDTRYAVLERLEAGPRLSQ